MVGCVFGDFKLKVGVHFIKLVERRFCEVEKVFTERCECDAVWMSFKQRNIHFRFNFTQNPTDVLWRCMECIAGLCDGLSLTQGDKVTQMFNLHKSSHLFMTEQVKKLHFIS